MSEKVIVVGGGPVGLMLALVLARQGVPSVVLEARAEPTARDESRAIVWMPKGLKLLDRLGISGGFASRGVRRTAHEFWAHGRPLLKTDFGRLGGDHPYTLQLPQHDSEVLLEAAARETGLVEVRRGHRVVGVGQAVGRRGAEATATVEGPEGGYELSGPWAVGCDGAKSRVRGMLGIGQRWRDYGADSAVADFEMGCDLPPDVSRIVLDPRRPHGFFYFAPGRWRLVYRLNPGEDRKAMTSERAAAGLLLSKLPGARVERFLWAGAFRLGQGQSETYRRGRWLLCGDAAHAMGPSAGAGMMVGVLGAWRLGWRLARALEAEGRAERLLEDYEGEQRAGSEQVQRSNAVIFRNMAMENRTLAALRSGLLLGASRLTPLARRMAEEEALLTQRVSALDADAAKSPASRF